MTNSDLVALRQIVAENPGISVEEIGQELLRARAERSASYRNQAGLDRGMERVLDRDY
jgi:hypothetical protein